MDGYKFSIDVVLYKKNLSPLWVFSHETHTYNTNRYNRMDLQYNYKGKRWPR
jgi:hypothetical protein